ncbi:MAG: alkaline phosphatase [Candidatus Cryptobacteroides sp.]
MKPSRYLSVALLILCTLGFSACCQHNDDSKAKYIFLFIGDGMGTSSVDMTESYLSYKAGKFGGEQLTFTRFPYFGTATTYSASQNITCSAAAGTAIATGHKTNNGSLGVDANGEPQQSMAEALHEEGYKVGIITSVTVNDATPGAFYAHNESRGNGFDIATQIVTSGFEYFAGNGFKQHKDKEGKYIGDYLSENGMTVCYSWEEYAEAGKDARILLCEPYNNNIEPQVYFAGGAVPEGHMTLNEFVINALDRFGEDPFFIMCEGGEIDWAAHANKTMPTVMSILAFDEAVKTAYEFYLRHPDETLLVVTADHETGGACVGSGDTHLYTVDWGPVDSAYTAAGNTNLLDQKANRELNAKSRIGWTTSDHTGVSVPVYAIGKGAERFCGRMDNTEIKGKILAEQPCKQ